MGTEPTPAPARPLAGRGIVVTRPAAQAERLGRLLVEAGAMPLYFPLIDIRPLADPADARRKLARLADYDAVVFVSANAVEQAAALLPAGASLGASALVAAVGPGTARALAAHGVDRVLLPSRRYDSEGLLERAELLAMQGRRVLIVRGRGGRELLPETLRARGATVEYAECYERAPPVAPVALLLDAWRADRLHAVTITSSEGLRHFHALLPPDGRERLRATPVFVTHERMHATARALGLDDVVLADAGDDGLHRALMHYYNTRPPRAR